MSGPTKTGSTTREVIRLDPALSLGWVLWNSRTKREIQARFESASAHTSQVVRPYVTSALDNALQALDDATGVTREILVEFQLVNPPAEGAIAAGFGGDLANLCISLLPLAVSEPDAPQPGKAIVGGVLNRPSWELRAQLTYAPTSIPERPRPLGEPLLTETGPGQFPSGASSGTIVTVPEPVKKPDTAERTATASDHSAAGLLPTAASLSSLAQAFALIESADPTERWRGVAILAGQRPGSTEVRAIAQARLIQLVIDPSPEVATEAWAALGKWSEVDPALAGSLRQVARICQFPDASHVSAEPQATKSSDEGVGLVTIEDACRTALEGAFSLPKSERMSRARQLLEQADRVFDARRSETREELNRLLQVLPELLQEGAEANENKELVELLRTVTSKAGCVLLSGSTEIYLRYAGTSFELKTRDRQRSHLSSHRTFPKLSAAAESN